VVVLVVVDWVLDDLEPCDAASATPPPANAIDATAEATAIVRFDRNTHDLLSGRGAFRP